MPTELNELVSDPQFHQLTIPQQLGILRDNYPDFSQLSKKDQGTFVSEQRTKFLGQDRPDFGNTQAPGADRNIVDTAKNAVKTGVKDIYAAGKTVAPRNAAEAALGPAAGMYRMAKGITDSHLEMAERAYKDLKAGQKTAAAVHAIAALTPVLGPMAVSIGDDVNNERYGQAATRLAEMLGPEAKKGSVLREAAGKTAEALTPDLSSLSSIANNKLLNNPAVRMALSMKVPGAGKALKFMKDGLSASEAFKKAKLTPEEVDATTALLEKARKGEPINATAQDEMPEPKQPTPLPVTPKAAKPVDPVANAPRVKGMQASDLPKAAEKKLPPPPAMRELPVTPRGPKPKTADEIAFENAPRVAGSKAPPVSAAAQAKLPPPPASTVPPAPKATQPAQPTGVQTAAKPKPVQAPAKPAEAAPAAPEAQPAAPEVAPPHPANAPPAPESVGIKTEGMGELETHRYNKAWNVAHYLVNKLGETDPSALDRISEKARKKIADDAYDHGKGLEHPVPKSKYDTGVEGKTLEWTKQHMKAMIEQRNGAQ